MHVFLYLYIHNKYTQYTHLYYVNKSFYLDAINRDQSFDSTSLWIKLFQFLIVVTGCYYRQAHGDEDTIRIVFNPKSKKYRVDPQETQPLKAGHMKHLSNKEN